MSGDNDASVTVLPVKLSVTNVVSFAALRIFSSFARTPSRITQKPVFALPSCEPPPRFNEASLIKMLERHGIGRPSTYAPILQTIISRGYVREENRRLYPTVETVFMMTGSEHSYLSSSIVKEIALLGGSVEGLVPDSVRQRLREKVGAKR